jgi:Zn finger protein HypA/HybF involved in hydrogenase expression
MFSKGDVIMDTQKPKTARCSLCGADMVVDEFGRNQCPKCKKDTQPKDLYEEALFDLKDYQK